jgi:hypothetical protein
MRRIILALMLALFLLTACNTPTTSPLPTQDVVATQVALLITNLPTQTLLAATQTPAPSPTIGQETPTQPQPTLTETLTLTLTPTAAGELKDSLGEPSWSDPLDSAKSFYLFENEGTRVTAENGALLLSGLQANGWLGWSLTYSRQPQNFYVEATFITQDCAGSDRYGLVFRAPNANAGYFFGVTCGGAFDLSAADFETDTKTDLVQASSNPAIVSGANQTNRLGVLANGETISLYANGKLLQEVNNATFKEKGYFGPFVAANQTAGFTVKMDEIKLWILP